MPQGVVTFLQTVTGLWDGLIFATASTPLLPAVDSQRKAVAVVLGAAGTVFGAGVGFALLLMSFVGLPEKVAALEHRMDRVAVDICVIRSAVDGSDPLICFLPEFNPDP